MEHGHHHAAHGHGDAVTEGHGASQHHEPSTLQPAFDPQDMRNMGGLWRRMPRTAITFVIGGLALAGFPIVTAGFWSKDEILADAFAHEHWIVFIVLAVAALLTAFYTARQIVMTFFGKPRTAAAEGANEHDSIFAWMTVPLMVLAFFAVTLGWIGIPTDFPILGQFSDNPFHHYIGSQAEALHIEAAAVPFNPLPLLTGVLVSLGGLTLGWLVYRGYASREMRAGEEPLALADPMAKPLARVYPILQNKYYFDELYDRVFVKGSQRLSNWLFKFDDLWVIDPLVDGVGRFWRRLSDHGQWLDTHIVDAAVNGIGVIAGWFGSALRVIQTGKAQNYLLVGLVTVSVLLAAFLLLPK
jgi:NADH-quinone oxidoreductase subunit L